MRRMGKIKKIIGLSFAVAAAVFGVTGIGLPGTVKTVCAEGYENYLKYVDSYGIFYYEENEDGEIVIQGYENGSSDRRGNLVIPAAINGKKVAEIGSYAFEDAYNKRAIVISTGIERIGSRAFDDNDVTRSVRVPSTIVDIGPNGLSFTRAIIYCDQSSAAYRYALEEELPTRPYEEYSDTAMVWGDVELEGAYMRDYTGSAICPKVNVFVYGDYYDEEKEEFERIYLTENTDYKVIYRNNTEVGYASVLVVGLGNYTGAETKHFVIKTDDYTSVRNLYISSSMSEGVTVVENDNYNGGGKGEIISTDLPAGMSYDPATNTLTLRDCTLPGGSITYEGSADLHIKVYGRNVFDRDQPGGINFLNVGSRSNIVYGCGDIYIEGNGSLKVDNYWHFLDQTNAWSDARHYQDGTIIFDGVSIETDSPIWGDYSDMILRNTTIHLYGDETIDPYSLGITTGRTGYEIFYEGDLTIENSVVEIKNFATSIAFNQCDLGGEYLYGGKTGAEYTFDQENAFTTRDWRTFNDCKYFLITSEKLDLPEIYRVRCAWSEGGDISTDKTLAFPGEQVNVAVTSDENYTFSHLLVNESPITGKSFVMPAQKVWVEGVFKEGAASQKPSGGGNTGGAGSNTAGSSSKRPSFPIRPSSGTSAAKKAKKPGKVKGFRVSNWTTGKKGELHAKCKFNVNVDGYQFQYARNRKFTKGKKTKTTPYSFIWVKKLKKGATYYVRVRAYNKANGKKLYGKWSKVKKIKLK